MGPGFESLRVYSKSFISMRWSFFVYILQPNNANQSFSSVFSERSKNISEIFLELSEIFSKKSDFFWKLSDLFIAILREFVVLLSKVAIEHPSSLFTKYHWRATTIGAKLQSLNRQNLSIPAYQPNNNLRFWKSHVTLRKKCVKLRFIFGTLHRNRKAIRLEIRIFARNSLTTT